MRIGGQEQDQRSTFARCGVGKFGFQGYQALQQFFLKNFVVLSSSHFIFLILHVFVHLWAKFHENLRSGTGSTIDICKKWCREIWFSRVPVTSTFFPEKKLGSFIK
jgi:hypothetical protein